MGHSWRPNRPVRGESELRRKRGATAVRGRSGKLRQGGLRGHGVGLTSSHQTGCMPLGSSWPPHVPLPLRLINSVEQTSTRPSHGKVLASLSYEPLGVCSLVRRQTPVGHVRAHVTRESHQPVRQQRGYDKWWSTAATPDSTRMTQVSLYIALNNFVPLHCATWILGVPR